MKQNDERKRENYYHDDVVVFVEKQNDIILKTQIYLIDKNKNKNFNYLFIAFFSLLYSKYKRLIFINYNNIKNY